MELPPGLPPMASGLFGFLGYDMVRDMERLPDKNPDPIGLPDAIMVRPTLICIFDRLEDNVTLVTPVWPQAGIGARAAYEAAQERLADAVSDFERSLPFRRESADALDDLPEPQANMSKDDFKKMVETCKEYIRAGDAFQIVPSQRFSLPFKLPPLSLYRSLRRINPSPFLIFFDYGDFSIVGSSPEILVRLRDNIVTIRPLAGTIRRGATPEEDKQLADELLADPKEHAEHLMLLDLARNDVGRVAKIGSVRVVEQFTIEKYSHLQHISSHVEGTLEDGLEAIDALKAGFPAGTLSGAPKVRAMEIIDEVEPVRRGIYAGCAGYFAANGSMDTCILLRTGLVKDNTMYVQAGVGVVADSDLEAEYQESVLKAPRPGSRGGRGRALRQLAGQWSAGNTRTLSATCVSQRCGSDEAGDLPCVGRSAPDDGSRTTIGFPKRRKPMSDWQKRYQRLLFDRPHPKVLRVTMNRPDKYNATDSIMHTELVNVWRDIDGDDTVNCVIIQGAGGKVFSAGGDFDLIEKNMKDYNALLRTWKEARDIVYNVINCSKPIVSTMRGPAVGAGLVAGILADVSIASKKAKIIDGHTRLGVAAGDHAAHRVAAALRHGQGQVLPAALRGGRRRGGRAHRPGLAVRRGRPARGQGPGGRDQARRRRADLDPLHQVRAQQLAAHDGPVLRRLDGARDAGLHRARGEGRPRLAPREAQAQVRPLLAA